MSDRAFEASASDRPANPDVFTQQHGSELPSVDDVLGPEPQKASYAPPAPPQQTTPASPKELPTVDDVLGPEPKKPPPRPITGAIAPGPVGDWIFGDTQHSSLARIMGAFGEAVDEGIGRYGEKLAMSEDTAKFLREKGIFNDYMKGQYSVFKSLNETLLRSGAVAVNGVMYGVPALWHGLQDAVIEAGEQAEGTRAGKAIGAKGLARSIAAVPEAFPDFNFGPSPKRFGRALMDEWRPRAPTPEQAGRQRILANFVPPPLAKAHDLAVIGGGEAEWKGIAPHETGSALVAEAAGAAEPAAPVDIHARARDIDPKTFKEFDALEKRQSLFRKWIEEGGTDVPPAVTTSLKETEARLRELEPVVTAAYEKAKAELPAAEATPTAPRLSDLPDDVFGPISSEAVDTRQNLETGAARLTLTPDEIAALQRSGINIDQNGVIDARGLNALEEERTRRQRAPAEPAAEAPPGRSIEAQRDYIAADVKRQLLAQGRPEDEAAAGAQLIADRYETRAARFNGALGTAEELYNREGAEIQELKRREEKIERKLKTPAARNAKNGFVEQMAGGWERERKRAEAGGSAVRIMTTAEKYAGVTEEEFNAAKREAEAAAPELKTLMTDDDWKAMAELFQREAAPPFYSAVARTIEGAKQAKASPEQWLATLRNTPGVKPEELEWLGIEDWLKEQKGSVTKDQIADYVRANQIEVKEVEKGAGDAKIEAVNREMNAAKAEWDHLSEIALRAPTPESRAASAAAYERFRSLSEQEDALRDERDRSRGETKFERYTLPRGENHRELLLTLPDRSDTEAYRVPSGHRYGDPESDVNRLAHIFMDDRVIDSKRTLLIKEAQSDWHAAGRHEGYKLSNEQIQQFNKRLGEIKQELANPSTSKERQVELYREEREITDNNQHHDAVPDAPFKTTWQELVMKRMVRYAAEHGYEQLAWVTGEERAAQYDVSKKVERLHYQKTTDGTGYLLAPETKGGREVPVNKGLPISAKDLPEHVGKELADKIIKGEGSGEHIKTLENIDLKIGGRMHRLLYDEQFPQAANKLGKKFGARVERSEVSFPRETSEILSDNEGTLTATKTEPVHTLPITDKLREAAVEQGFPLFQGEQRALGSFLPRGEGKPGLLKLARDADASTFIHESGHDFLEQLMRDDAHPLAPAALKADAKTIRDWLGIESHQDLNTGWPGERGKAARRAHEKFARGFEQYLRLGYAPSPGLRDVFAKFEAWLTKIYTTLRGLGAPISEDIRQVFDRMLAEHPQRQERTVIAPEREAAPSLGERHAAHAETTAPHFANEVANEIREERDTYAGQNLVEDEHARLEGVDRGAGERAPGTAQPAGHANAPGAERPETRAPAEPGGERPGGDQVAAEGAGAPASAGVGAGVKTEVPDSAARPFEPAPTQLTDKIGNFRIDGLNVPEHILAAMRENVEKRGGLVEQHRRGIPASDGDLLNLSLASGLSPAWLDAKKIGDTYSRREIKALEELLITTDTAVKDAAVAAETGDPKAVIALAVETARLEMIQAHLAGASAEAGRSLGAVRSVVKRVWGDGRPKKTAEEAAQSLARVKQLAEQKWESLEALSAALKKETGRELFQLQQMAQFMKRLTTPGQVANFVHATADGKIRHAIVYYYVNALLSGPITHLMYAIGNAVTAVYSPLVRTPFTAAVDFGAYHAGLQNERRVFLGEAGAELYALGRGTIEGIAAGKEGWQLGTTPDLPGEGASQNLFGAQPVIPPIPGKIGYAIGIPGKGVGAIHGFGAAVRYRQEVNRLAYRKAMREGQQGNDFIARIAELSDRPPPEIMEAAAKVSRSDLYMAVTNYNSFSAQLARIADSNMLAKIILPFTKIGIQVETKAIDNSVLGIFRQQVRANLFGEHGIEARNTQAASIIGGTALMAGMATLVAEGYATGEGPDEPEQREIWSRLHKPYSLEIGGLQVPYKKLGYLGILMGIAANAAETHKGWDEAAGNNIAMAYIHGFQKAILDDSWMRGMKDMLDAVYHWEQYGDRWIANMVTNWMPFSVGMGQLARFVDPYQRETKGNRDDGAIADVLETIFKEAWAKIPFASKGLYAKRDIFGEKILSGGVNPNYANDPTVRAMENLQIKVGKLRDHIRGIKLTDAQFDDYSRIAGRTTKKALDELVRTLGPLLHGSPEDRAKLVDLMHKTINLYRGQAAKTVMMNAYGSDNDILRKATQNKMIKKGAAPGPVVH